jgi:DUF4097 and DUF4098 domain-containing protein YvlB
MSEERQMILGMLQEGRVTVEEAERLLAAIYESPLADPLAEEQYSDGEPPARGGGETWDPAAGGGAWGDAMWPAPHSGDQHDTFDTTAVLPTGGRIRLNDAHGGVRITGADVDEVQVRVLKRVRADDPALARRLLQAIRISVEAADGELVVGSSRPQRSDPRLQGHVRGMWVFYDLVVPRRAGATVRFEHGGVQVANLEGTAELAGSHGDWVGSELAGPVRLRHEHGAVRLTDLGSGAEVQKGHGPLELAGIRGDVRLKSEHSHVGLTRLDGSLELSGSHGNIDARDLAGPVRVRHEHGALRLTNLGAGLVAQKNHGSLDVAGVHGDVRLDSGHGSRSLSDITGGVEVRHSHGSLELRGLGGRLQAKAQHARLDVEFARPPTGDVSLRLEHCQASLKLPANSSLRIEIATEHGKIEAPGLAEVEKGRHSVRARGTLGGGEHRLSIEGCHSGVSLLTEDVPEPSD